MTEPFVERITDDNGDELEHGTPDFPSQFAIEADPASPSLRSALEDALWKHLPTYINGPLWRCLCGERGGSQPALGTDGWRRHMELPIGRAATSHVEPALDATPEAPGLDEDLIPTAGPAHLHDPFDPARHRTWLNALGHDPQPDGRCEHRWRNRSRRVVRCPFLDGFRAALSAPGAGEGER